MDERIDGVQRFERDPATVVQMGNAVVTLMTPEALRCWRGLRMVNWKNDTAAADRNRISSTLRFHISLRCAQAAASRRQRKRDVLS